MPKTTTEKDYDFGVIPNGYVSDDGNGHKGFGYSPEKSQAALEQAQRDNVEYTKHKSITGLLINGPKK